MLLFSSKSNLIFIEHYAMPLGIEKENGTIDFIFHSAAFAGCLVYARC